MSIKHTFLLGDTTYSFETGEIAKQASGAVELRVLDTVILATTVISDRSKRELSFVPLTVDYAEKAYAAGRIPGGHLKREGLPPDHATRVARRIDRAIRPLFPEGFRQETQVVVQVLSSQPEVSTDILATMAASAALALTGIAVRDYVGSVRVNCVDDRFIVNPPSDLTRTSMLEVLVASSSEGIITVDGTVQEQPDDVVQDAIAFAHLQNQCIIKAIRALVQKADVAPICREEPSVSRDLAYKLYDEARYELDHVLDAQPEERHLQLDAVRKTTRAALLSSKATPEEAIQFENEFNELTTHILRHRLVTGEERLDGRNAYALRMQDIEIGILPRAHGSALLTQGDSQILSIATLGSPKEAQLVELLGGKQRDHFMLHSNSLPFATGHAGRFGIPKRSDIEQGHLTKRALMSVLPPEEDFPYAIRLVCERLESGDASAMPGVCAASLALFDAGVPIRTSVAGITVGVVEDGPRHVLLCDITDEEYPLCALTVSVAGTVNGMTALQIDSDRIDMPISLLADALTRAREGRLAILDAMHQAMREVRPELSVHAPRIVTFKIPSERVKTAIGENGNTVRTISEETKTIIVIDDCGLVSVAAHDLERGIEAQRRIELQVADVELDKSYVGTVDGFTDTGVLVQILPSHTGLLPTSEVSSGQAHEHAEPLEVGHSIRVRAVYRDELGRVLLASDNSERPT